MTAPRQDGPAVTLRSLSRADAPALAELGRRNRADMERTGPPRPPGGFAPAAQVERIEGILADCARGTREFWVIEVDGVLAGDISLHGIERGPVQTANVGYLVDGAFRGRGVATSALRLAVAESFGRLHLHRLDAGAQPGNLGSRRVLEKAGFTRVGVQRRLLFVDGRWRDHVLYELVGPDFVPDLGW